jgi:hypothetical protein
MKPAPSRNMRGYLLAAAMLAAACTRTTSIEQPPPPTSAASLEFPAAVLIATSTDEPAASPTIEAPAVVATCQNGAAFLEDLSIPDGSLVGPGQTLVKRWAVQNVGTCDWGSGYQLARIGQDELAGPQAVPLFPAKAGASAVWEVELKAPLSQGDYLSRWQAEDPQGNPFGDEVFLLITVQSATDTPSPTPLPGS